MKLTQFICYSIAVFLFFIPFQKVTAHLPGQEPYFAINGKYSGLYPVLVIPSSQKFTLPQDLAPETYKIGQELTFELVKEKLPFSEETIKNTEFYWDFGDKGIASGLKNTHTYTKNGSYILEIHADYDKTDAKADRQLLQSVLINIVEDTKKPLPTIEINVNGKPTDPKDTLKLDITKSNTFEAVLKNADPATTKFIWDLSDGTSLKGPKITYKNTQNFLIINPVVHAVTKDGYIVDKDVVIENDKNTSNGGNLWLPLILVNSVGLLLLGGIILFSKRKSSSKTEKK